MLFRYFDADNLFGKETGKHNVGGYTDSVKDLSLLVRDFHRIDLLSYGFAVQFRSDEHLIGFPVDS